ncbi:MAG: hypothetical protein M3Z33_11305 [Actinomycetota bacterium]|nr:hypothetical protein [Actinomycetota bacterium]
MTVDEQLEWERRWALRAAASAAASGVLLIAYVAVSAVSPHPSVDELTTLLLFFSRHGGNALVSSALLALGWAAAVLPLIYLYRATKFRRPALPPAARATALFGAVAVALFGLIQQIALNAQAHDFATHGAQTFEQAKHALQATGLQVVQSLNFAGQLALGFGLVMIALNAMRVGLLTRFMGIVGIICGVVTGLAQLLGQPPVLQAFWLLSLAYLVSGRWPNGVPSAWSSGKAEPWPTQQELREARERGEGRPSRGKATPQPELQSESAAAGTATAQRTHSASKKRKRKRRR